MIGHAISKNGVKIRLTEERWFHIVENHDELAGKTFDILEAVEGPDLIMKGVRDELLACKIHNDKYLVVAYKEENKRDGFVITGYLTKDVEKLKKREIVWKRQS